MNINHKNCKYYFQLGQSLESEEKLEQSENIYRRAIELDPNYSWCHHYLGKVLEKQGKLQEAITAYSQAIELYPNFSWSYFNLGNILERLGDLNRAIDLYQKAIALYPNYFVYHHALEKALNKQTKIHIPQTKNIAIRLNLSCNNLRIAIISTPRSGNTWLRKLLASMYELPQIAAHTPIEVPWQSLPEKIILQLHWSSNCDFISLLAKHRFIPVAIARHPLDILISVLHFAAWESQTARWLDGEAGNEISIIGKSPLSSDFIDYATSQRAKSLLSITPSWWSRSDVMRIRYEDLVMDTSKQLFSFNEQFGLTTKAPISDIVLSHSLEKLRKTATNKHFWQGKYGQWKQLLTAPVAKKIALTHQDVLEQLGYECDPDLSLTEDKAMVIWKSIASISC